MDGKSILESKIFWLNAFSVVIMIAELSIGIFNFTEDALKIILFVIGIANIGLRFVTTQHIESILPD